MPMHVRLERGLRIRPPERSLAWRTAHGYRGDVGLTTAELYSLALAPQRIRYTLGGAPRVYRATPAQERMTMYTARLVWRIGQRPARLEQLWRRTPDVATGRRRRSALEHDWSTPLAVLDLLRDKGWAS